MVRRRGAASEAVTEAPGCPGGRVRCGKGGSLISMALSILIKGISKLSEVSINEKPGVENYVERTRRGLTKANKNIIFLNYE
jgi:hypothetical protein